MRTVRHRIKDINLKSFQNPMAEKPYRVCAIGHESSGNTASRSFVNVNKDEIMFI